MLAGARRLAAHMQQVVGLQQQQQQQQWRDQLFATNIKAPDT
jgi:hypothetical protein